MSKSVAECTVYVVVAVYNICSGNKKASEEVDRGVREIIFVVKTAEVWKTWGGNVVR